MYVSPIRNIENKSQNPTFNAVNQKYYKWGIKEIVNLNAISYELIYQLESETIAFKTIAPQDAVDTLLALREKLKPKNYNSLNESLGTFKQLADKQRPQLKKFLKKISQ